MQATLKFTKMQGTGNDFIIVSAADAAPLRSALSAQDWLKCITRICDRHFGLGADGFMVTSPADGGRGITMEYYNSDGSAAAFCGNGARCVARFAALNGWIENRGSIHAAVGEVDCRVLEGGRIAIHMPDAPLPVYVDSEGGYFINTGVPHLVKEVAFSSDGEFTLWAGQRAVPSRQFPEGVNVDAYCQEESRLRVRTYERGVNAETLSCGTGVVATALTAAYVGALAEGSMSIFTRGGKLGVDFTRSGEQPGFQNVWLSGPAERIAEGVFYYNE